MVAGRTREAIRRPRYSSSVPAIASGTIGASVRSAMTAQPVAERPDPARRPADGPLGHLGEDRAVGDDGPRRRDVLLDPDAAAPDRQQAADAVDEPLAPARREGRRARCRGTRRAAGPGSRASRRTGPSSRGAPPRPGGSRPGQVLLAGRPDPEPEDAEEDEPADQPEEPIRAATPSPPGAGRARPGPSDGAAARGGERLRRDRGPAADGAVRSLADGPGPPCQVPAGSCRSGSGEVRRRVGSSSPSTSSPACFVTGWPRRRARRPSVTRRRRRRRRLLVVVVLVVVVRRRHRRCRRRTRRARPAARARPTWHPGMARRIVQRMTRAVAPGQDQQRRDDEQHRHDLRGRDPEERPVVLPERLEHEPDQAVPDEEEQDQVARPQPLARVEPEPDQEERPEQPGQRLVQEQRMEARRLERERRRTGRRRSDGRNRSGCPTAASSAGRTAPG